MARLPVPGSDENTWGNVLNDFLAQAHNTDGTIKDSAIGGLQGTPVSAAAPADNDVLTYNSATSQWEPAVAAGGAVSSVAGKTGAVTLVAADITDIGGSATLDIGTTAGTVAAGDDSRITGAQQRSTLTTKGDIYAATASATTTRVGVGTNNQILTADSAQATGIKWADPPVSYEPWQFHVSNYGAVGDNTTDDRAAIQAAIDAAVTYALANNYHAEVLFDPVTYYIGSAAPTSSQGTNTQSVNWANRGMLKLPMIETTGRKLLLTFQGSGDGSHTIHWLQTVPNNSGTIIRTDATGLTIATVNGVSAVPASIIGGPMFASGNHWTNLSFTIDQIMVMGPQNPTMVGIDTVKVAQFTGGSFGAMAYVPVVGGAPNMTTTPTDDDGFGWRAPDVNSNHKTFVDSYTCEGFYYGMTMGDHLAAQRLLFVYCRDAIYHQGPGTFVHGNTILNLGIEACTRGLVIADTSGFSSPIFIGALHTETLGGVDIDDPGNHLAGLIYWHAISRTAPSLNGAGRVRILNERIGHGAITGTVAGISLPAVPASTTPLTNPYYRDMAVAVAGGTVTDIAIDGQATGLTSGMVIVPSGKTITLTYSVAPTWTWTAL